MGEREFLMSLRRGGASRWVADAIKRGALPSANTQKCTDCGATAECYDHRDYSRPEFVQPVCHSCDTKRGPGKPYPISTADLEKQFSLQLKRRRWNNQS